MDPLEQFGCRCQKHPWTKITFRRDGKTMSGFPGRSDRCSRNLYPQRCSRVRRVRSGIVFLAFTCRISALRLAADRLSNSAYLPRREADCDHHLRDIRLSNLSSWRSTQFQESGRPGRFGDDATDRRAVSSRAVLCVASDAGGIAPGRRTANRSGPQNPAPSVLA